MADIFKTEHLTPKKGLGRITGRLKICSFNRGMNCPIKHRYMHSEEEEAIYLTTIKINQLIKFLLCIVNLRWSGIKSALVTLQVHS